MDDSDDFWGEKGRGNPGGLRDNLIFTFPDFLFGRFFDAYLFGLWSGRLSTLTGWQTTGKMALPYIRFIFVDFFGSGTPLLNGFQGGNADGQLFDSGGLKSDLDDRAGGGENNAAAELRMSDRLTIGKGGF